MSIAAVSSSQLGGALNSVVSNTLSAGIVSATLNGGTGASAAGSAGLPTDFTSLLQALVSGDQAATKTALAKLQSDSGAGSASPATGSATGSAATNTSRSFSTALSSSLSSGNIQGALSALTSFLVSTGQASGNLVNTTA